MSNLTSRLGRATEGKGGARQVRLRLVYVDFWSTLKLSLLITIALSIVQLVAVFIVWLVLNQLGVFAAVGDVLGQLVAANQLGLINGIGLPQVMLFTLISGLITIVFGTALGAVGALLYNLSVRVTGGLLVGFTNNA